MSRKQFTRREPENPPPRGAPHHSPRKAFSLLSFCRSLPGTAFLFSFFFAADAIDEVFAVEVFAAPPAPEAFR